MSVLTRAEAIDAAVDRIYDRAEDGPSGCLLWTGPLNHAGYAVVRIPGGFGTTGAHRAVYEWAYGGPLPEDMHVEHSCHSDNLTSCKDGRTCLHRRCVRPAHLELITPAENNRRGMKAQKTVCCNGHARNAENTYTRHDGRRQCRACNRDRERIRAARLKGEAAA